MKRILVMPPEAYHLLGLGRESYEEWKERANIGTLKVSPWFSETKLDQQ